MRKGFIISAASRARLDKVQKQRIELKSILTSELVKIIEEKSAEETKRRRDSSAIPREIADTLISI
jgi:hypothetical protein